MLNLFDCHPILVDIGRYLVDIGRYLIAIVQCWSISALYLLYIWLISGQHLINIGSFLVDKLILVNVGLFLVDIGHCWFVSGC